MCDKIARMRFVDVKLDHLQMVVDESGKNYPTLRKLKVPLGLMYKYAIIHEIIPKERNLVEYLNIKNAGNPNAYNRKPFSKAEVKRVWDVKDSNIYYTVILMLIYSRCRIGELLDLKTMLTVAGVSDKVIKKLHTIPQMILHLNSLPSYGIL